ncbi:MAG: hypothetical protein IPG60_09955 [Bacteroidetes bacterium]|nr:hypothetical protein [Bacteroidota bacterium]MBP7400155.1 hypothetical protein [Chitinophagales bacterium]MBK7108763.1 hypothetical protein [Bacteroidota bacterium]MBK8488913.1 hypothetical protein [Bacteroidota bacterium]MBK8680763.1 hypothetical protein [Bacteroidota bacterium]
MKRFLIITIILLSCEIGFAQDHSIKIAPFHFLYTPIPKVDYEFAFKTNRSIGITIDYYNFSASDNGVTFKPYYRYYFEGKNTMPSRGFYIMPSMYLGQTNQQYYYGSCSWSGSCFDTIIS